MNHHHAHPATRLQSFTGSILEPLEPRSYLSGVAVSGVAPTGDFAVSSPTGKFPVTVVGGSIQKGGAAVAITYNGAATITNAVVTTTLYASATQLIDSSAVTVGKAVTERIGKLKPGRTLKIHFAPFAYPQSPGVDYLVSDVALNGNPDSFDGATFSPIAVQAPFVDADALAAAPVTTKLVANRRASAIFTIENLGNIAITSADQATVDVGVVPPNSPAGTTPTSIALSIPVKLHLNAGQKSKVRVSFTPTALPASGSYDLSLQINLAGDTNTSNDAVFSTTPIPI